jgi:hypothetical protein
MNLVRLFFERADFGNERPLILILKINPVSAHLKWHDLLLLEIAEDLCQRNIIL